MARIWNEKFEAIGYDEVWSQGETIGAGNTVDEDANPADVGNPASWGGRCIKMINGGTNVNTYVSHAGLAKADTWLRFEFVLSVESMEQDDFQYFWQSYNGGNPLYRFNVKQKWDGTFPITLKCYHDGGINSYEALSPLVVGTKHRIEVKWDSTNNVWAWRLDGVNQPNDQDGTDPVESEGVLSNTHETQLDQIYCGLQNQSHAMTMYYDLVAIDDADWVGAEPLVSLMSDYYSRFFLFLSRKLYL